MLFIFFLRPLPLDRVHLILFDRKLRQEFVLDDFISALEEENIPLREMDDTSVGNRAGSDVNRAGSDANRAGSDGINENTFHNTDGSQWGITFKNALAFVESTQ